MSRLPADAFDYYAAQGPDRSYQAVADHFGVTKRAVTKRAAAEHWQGRIRDIEAQARRGADDRARETLEDMNLRHLRSLRAIQGKALETLRTMSLDSAMDAVRALDLAIRNERLIRGEPSDRTAITVEDVIRSEYERWLGVENAEADDS